MIRQRNLIPALSLFVLFFCSLANAQTINYVQQDVVLTSGKTTDAQVNALGIGQVQTTKIYVDGLGREIQEVAVQASPNSNKDIIQVRAYNSNLQEAVQYLPYVDNTGNYSTGVYRTSAINDQHSYFANSNPAVNQVNSDAEPFKQKVFENSPLRRLLEIGDFGSGFQPGEHYKTYTYRSNNSTDNVLMWGVNGNYLNQFYAPNSLSVEVILKADNVATTLVFTDASGNVVLKRKVLSSTVNLDTYYLYNAAGEVAYIITPQAVTLMNQSGNYALTQTNISNLIYSYYYDNLGRVVQRNVPGAAPVYYIYDPLNRIVLVQDGDKRTNNQWFYIKYDAKTRPVSYGIYTDANAAHKGGLTGGMQAYVSGYSGYASYSFETRSATGPSYYTNNCFPTLNNDNSALADLSYVYYDDYFLTGGTTPDFSYVYQSLPGELTTNAATNLTRGLPTMFRKRTVGLGLGNIWLVQADFYDNKGNTIQVQTNNHLGSLSGGNVATDYNTSVVDFTGKTLVNLTKKSAGTAGTVSVRTTYTYDAHNIRPLYVDQVYNTQASVRIASYKYNELGQLVRKNLEPNNTSTTGEVANLALTPSNSVAAGSTTNVIATNSITFTPTATQAFTVPSTANYSATITDGALQSVDFRYNIRGQLTSINNSTLTSDGGATNTDTNDLFGMQIMYDQPDAALNSTTITTKPSFTGKISAVKWMTVDNNMRRTNERSYVYNYDEAGRITSALYAERPAGSSSGTTFSVDVDGFDESNISYDNNGNILSLNRNSSTVGASSYTQIDQLVYSYNPNNPNRLSWVSDANNSTSSQYTNFGFQDITGNTSTAYGYTAGGNLTTDPYKGMSIGYNILGKTDNVQITQGPGGVAITGSYINYTYDADGSLIRKQQYVTINGTPAVTTTDYIGGFVFVNNTLSYFPMKEGRVVYANGTLKPEFIIADYQGNARFSFQDNGNGGVAIVQENSYYAFGLALANSPIVMPGSNPNKQLYNGGAEWQNDFNNLPNYYASGARNYDPTIGRFIGIDAYAETSVSLTGYHYAKNNPTSLNDPDGTDPGDGTDGTVDDPGDTNPDGTQPGNGGQSPGSSTVGTDAGGQNNGTQHYAYYIDEAGALVIGMPGGTPIPIPGDVDRFYLATGWNYDTNTGMGIFTQTTEISPSDAFDLTEGEYGYSDDNIPGQSMPQAAANNSNNESDGPSSLGGRFISGFMSSDDPTNFGHPSSLLGDAGLVEAQTEGLMRYTLKTTVNTLADRAMVLRSIKGAARTGATIGVLSIGATFLEDAQRKQGITTGTFVKGAVLAVGVAFPVFGLVYGIVDLGVGLITHKSITDRLGDGVDNAISGGN